MSASNDTADTKPDLKVISADEADSADAQATQPAVDAASEQTAPDAPREPAPSEAPPERSRLPLLLGVALVFAIVFALWQGQRADRLASEVGLLEAELSVIGVELSAHKAQLSRVRVGIDDLTSRAQALSDLAHAEPSISSVPSAASSSEAEAPVESGGDGYTSPSESGIVDF